MQFNSEANNQDLVSDVKYWCGIPTSDTTTYSINDITRNANFALDRIVSLIMNVSKRWKWDDSNNATLPIATTTLVNAQADYALDITHMKIMRVRIKDNAGNYYTINPVRREELTDAEIDEADGAPMGYSKVGRSIILYPAPATGQVTMAAGLEVQFERGASYFAVTDTTKVPGFDSQFHRLISLYAARDYLLTNNIQSTLQRVENEILKLETELINFMGNRDEDSPNAISVYPIRFR